MPTETKNLLLVEDDPQDELLTRQALRKAKVTDDIDVVRDGAEALDYLFCEGAHAARSPDNRPAVVLMDLNLPKLSGLEVLSKLRSDPRTVKQPVVILTSSDEEKDLLRCYELGANSYVRKPVDFREFNVAIANLGVYWLALNEIPRNWE